MTDKLPLIIEGQEEIQIWVRKTWHTFSSCKAYLRLISQLIVDYMTLTFRDGNIIREGYRLQKRVSKVKILQ